MIDMKELSAYELLEQVTLNGIHSEGMIIKHKKTGARICLVSNQDENKVFQIGFRTPPTDNTGVPHIIEHTVLCGSSKYPLKDPFVELMKGSLNTFLNAITYPDKTIYPVASCNDKDFQNLCDVYMDAVFHPNIYKQPEIFKQEGWHYEMESEDSPLTLNGVVYNEMKGAYSSPDEILMSVILKSLYPDNCYSKDSGGNPEQIPELTREDYLDFHRRYYHPSNAFIYLYGNMDMVEKLKWMDQEYLGTYDFLKIDSSIKEQEPFHEMKREKHFYNISSTDPLSDSTYLAYNVVVGDALDQKLYVAFEILQYALLAAPGAPVKQALLDAGIGKDISGTYASAMKQPYFSIVAQNTNPEDFDRFEKIVRETLTGLVKTGLNKKTLEAGLNSSEFRYREADFGNFPKGLLYGIQILDSWLYDERKPFIHVDALETYSFLKEQIEHGYFEQIIQTYLLDNQHASLVCLAPQRGLNDEKERKLSDELEKRRLSMTQEERLAVVEDTKQLKLYQETPTPKEDMEKIPLLQRKDLRRTASPIENQMEEIDGVTGLYHNIETNGIHYLTMCFDISQVPEELIPYMGLLKASWGYVNTEHYTYAELSSEIDRKTGGIGASTSVYPNVKEDTKYRPMFEVRCKTLNGKLSDAVNLICEIIQSSSYRDEKRMYEIIAELKSKLQVSISASGHSAAILRATSYFSDTARYRELLGGIEFYHLVEKIEREFKEEKDGLFDKLESLTKMIFRKENLFFSSTCDEAEESLLKPEIEKLISVLNTEPVNKGQCHLTLEKKNEGFLDASQVQYVVRAGNFKESGYCYKGTMNIVKNILNNEYLWVNVRVKGGAYGCMSGLGRNGSVYLASYRDPNLQKTNQVYEEVPDYIENFEADERELTKYIIGTISEMDTPLTPASRGERSLGAYLTGLSIEQLQKERDQILGAQIEDIRDAAEPLRAALKQNYFCVIGNETKIKENSSLFDQVLSLN